MAKRRIYEDHVMTSSEKSRRHSDSLASIDEEMDEAFMNIDWNRRLKAETDIIEWTKTYCIGTLLDTPPSDKGCEVLRAMDAAWNAHQNYLILMGRGQGKTSFELIVTLKNLLTKNNQHIVIVSNNSRASSGLLKDLWRVIEERETILVQDYPILLPFHLCNGSFRRRQQYRGKSTNIERNASNISFPTLKTDDERHSIGSAATLTVRSISGAIRGIRPRPTTILLDDLQDAEIAQNEEQVDKLMTLLKKDIMNLGGGYSQRLSIIQTATIIQNDDFVDKLRHDKNWKTQLYKSIIKFPDDMKLWDQYFEIWNQENMEESDHSGSLKFYKENYNQMNEGVEVFNDKAYHSSDGHISAIQKLLEIREMIGEDAFLSEYQQTPKKFSVQLEISPKDVIDKKNQYQEGFIPDGFTSVFATTDLNLATHLTTTICAYKPDMTSVVLKHIITKSRIDGKLNDTAYNQLVYQKLIDLGKKIKNIGTRIDGWGIDCNGVPFEAVTDFCKNSFQLCGIKSVGMIGRASKMFNPFVKSRLREPVARTVLCGDQQEHLKNGAGKKWVAWDSDFYKVGVQKSFLAPVLSKGSCSLYDADSKEHADFAKEICGEKLKYIKHKSNGIDEYFWKTSEDNHYLDAMAMNYALAASQGISSSIISQTVKKRILSNRKTRYRFI